MDTLPEPIRVDIVRRLGNHGFRELAPLIAAGPESIELAFDDRVLSDVEIDEFVFVSALANEGSIYRPFFVRCFQAGNPTAKYVEGLRLATQKGPSQVAIDLLASAAPSNIYARFALGTFLICCGSFDQGMEVYHSFFRLLPSMEEAIGVAEIVISQITDMGTPHAGLYEPTFRFGGLPHCFYSNYSVQHLCRKCFAFKYASRVLEIC